MPLPDPFRLQVQKALTRILEEINGEEADGYHYDLRPTAQVPQRVFRGRVYFDDNDPLPMLSILQVPVPIDPTPVPKTAQTSTGPWELILQGWVKDDKDNPTDNAEKLLADVKRRLHQERCQGRGYEILDLGTCVTELNVGSGVVRPADEVSAKAYFWLNITVGLVENWTQNVQK